MALHIIPLNDLEEHVEDSTCKCCPRLIMENGEMILVHNSFDGREIRERLEERRKKLQEKIDKTTDHFFIYGYVKQLERIEEELSMLPQLPNMDNTKEE
jgi:hypothetical protein